MRYRAMSRWSAAMIAATLLTGCSMFAGNEGKGSSSSSKDAQQQQPKAQSTGGSELDKELQRQAAIYREILRHNAKTTQDHLEADRKLLKGMEKNEQEAKQRALKALQERQGIVPTGKQKVREGQGGDKQQE